MQLIPLELETMAKRSATHVAILTYADLAALANGNTGTVNLATVVAGQGAFLVDMELDTAFVFSDGTLISSTMSVGDTGSATRFMAAAELNAAGSFINLKGGAINLASGPFVYTAGDTIQATFTGTAAKNLNTATAGQVRIYLDIFDSRPQSG